MKLLILYASTEGQTQKIARYVFDRLIAEDHSVELVEAKDARDLSPAEFDGAILAASVHAGRYQSEFVEWAKAETAALERTRTLFLSVSLSAAGNDEEDWDGLRACVAGFETETGWKPRRVEHVAGAFRYREYDFFSYWAMRWIQSRRDTDTSKGKDKEYTDWAALGELVDAWVAEVRAA